MEGKSCLHGISFSHQGERFKINTEEGDRRGILVWVACAPVAHRQNQEQETKSDRRRCYGKCCHLKVFQVWMLAVDEVKNEVDLVELISNASNVLESICHESLTDFQPALFFGGVLIFVPLKISNKIG